MVSRQRAGVRHLHHLPRQSFGKFVASIERPAIIPKIIQFVRVARQIVKLAPLDAFVQRQAGIFGDQATGAKIVLEPHIAAALMLFDEHRVVAGVMAVERRKEIIPLHSVMAFEAGARQDRARQIDGAAQIRIDDARVFCSRVSPDEWHADEPAKVERAFEEELMVAHEIAVIAGENHHGVTLEPQGPEPAEDAADGVVYHRDHPVGECNRLARLALRNRKGSLTIFQALIACPFVVEFLQVGRNPPLSGME